MSIWPVLRVNQPTAMTAQYNTIHQFLQNFAPEIGGRSVDTVTPDLQQSITAFAQGNLDEAQVNELSRELLANESGLEMLAAMIKGE